MVGNLEFLFGCNVKFEPKWIKFALGKGRQAQIMQANWDNAADKLFVMAKDRRLKWSLDLCKKKGKLFCFMLVLLVTVTEMLDKLFATVFRLCRTARSASVAVSADLLLACCLANAACAIMNIVTALIFIIVSRLHAFFLVVPVRSFLHALVVVAVISYFQHSCCST